MKPLPLHKSIPNASRLAFGCMGLGGEWNEPNFDASHVKQANNAVDAALDVGINFFDHADIYTRGKAEQVFAEVLKQRPELKQKMILQSKCSIRLEDDTSPQRYDASPEWINESVDGILSRLNVEHIDILLLHRPDPLMEPELVAETFSALKASGKVSHFGVSNMHAQQMAFLQHYLDEPLVVNQIEISLRELGWVNEVIMAGNPEGSDINFAPGTLEYCRQHNVQIQSWGSLAQGLYSGKNLSQEHQVVQETATMVAHLAHQYGVSHEAIVLAWLLRHPAQIQPVIGTTNPERIAACNEALKVTLTRDEWYGLFATSRGERLP